MVDIFPLQFLLATWPPRATVSGGTDTNARTTANVLLASAGVAAAYVILTRPPLRRLAFRMARL